MTKKTKKKTNHRTMQRSLKVMRDAGYIAEPTERKIRSFVTKDLFGFVDLVAVGNGETIGVQTTTYANTSARVKKITGECAENLAKIKEAGWRVLVHGWHKKDNRWIYREVEL